MGNMVNWSVVLVGIGCVLGYLVMLVVYWLFIGQKELVVYWLGAYTTNFCSKNPGITFVSLVVSNIYRDEVRLVVYWSPIIGRTEHKSLVVYWSCPIWADDTTNFLRAVLWSCTIIEQMQQKGPFRPSKITSSVN
jgi:hypothetical protein